MAKTKTTRQSTPKTAYELLERVCEAIRDNPLNYYQSFWKVRRGKVDGWSEDPLPDELDVPENRCGTAFCRAGWIVALHDGRTAIPASWGARSDEIVGLDSDSTNYLYDGNACGALTPGTRAYAREGVRGLRAFMKQHAKHLKARLLKDVPKRA